MTYIFLFCFIEDVVLQFEGQFIEFLLCDRQCLFRGQGKLASLLKIRAPSQNTVGLKFY